MLLTRNQKSGISTKRTCAEQEAFNIIPQWLLDDPTPWNLVSFFNKTLSRCVKDGQEKTLVNGHRAELRPAKVLLEKYGIEKSAQLILDKAQTLTDVGGFTLWRVVDHGKQVEKQVAKRRHAKRLQPISSDQKSR